MTKGYNSPQAEALMLWPPDHGDPPLVWHFLNKLSYLNVCLSFLKHTLSLSFSNFLSFRSPYILIFKLNSFIQFSFFKFGVAWSHFCSNTMCNQFLIVPYLQLKVSTSLNRFRLLSSDEKLKTVTNTALIAVKVLSLYTLSSLHWVIYMLFVLFLFNLSLFQLYLLILLMSLFFLVNL